MAVMEESGLVPLYYNPDLEIMKKIIENCYDGGSRIFEFTNRGDGAHQLFAELIKFTSQNFPDLMLGVGTVLESTTAGIYIQLGSNFVISPILDEQTGQICNRRKVLWMPGCATFTEISNAEALGAEVIKVFPANLLGGPAFVKSITGPCPWIKLMPSGGVAPTPENLKPWFESGATCVGMGSNLFTKDIIKNKDYGSLKNTVTDVLGIIKNAKKNLI